LPGISKVSPWILYVKVFLLLENDAWLVKNDWFSTGHTDFYPSFSCSESSLHHVSIQWNIEAVLSVLQFIYCRSLNITPNGFLFLLEVMQAEPLVNTYILNTLHM